MKEISEEENNGYVVINFVRERVESSLVHRVDRVLSFLSSRQNSNWDSPTPSHAGQCAPPPLLVPKGSTLAYMRGGWEGGTNYNRHCSTLGICVLSGLV
jgi:hypothetical protein